MQSVIISRDLAADLDAAIRDCRPDRLFVLTDTTTEQHCWPIVRDFPCLAAAEPVTIPATDAEKTLGSVTHVWEELQRGGATRHSLLVNLGGGMVTDLGGFAAATFKRGISFINVPTTLLALVDASVGGKTGFNFGGLKNEIGVFAEPRAVILSTDFLPTLDDRNMRSGYAEMLKHALINPMPHGGRDGRMWNELTDFDIARPDLARLRRMVAESVAVKEHIVARDPRERGLRKALNLGHTAGHAIESWAMRRRRPTLHGYAVACGLIPELYLSAVKTGFPETELRRAARYIREVYGTPPVTCDDYPELLELMTHDKKNTAGRVNFTLLRAVGDAVVDQTATDGEIREALDFMREG